MRYLIVDGHSAIFAWPDLRELHGRRTALGRGALINALTRYQDASQTRVVVVFDGRGERVNEQTEPGGIQIFYSGSGQTADDVIEQLVAKYASHHELIVATSDSLEQDTVTAFGATAISVVMLRSYLHEAESDLARRLKAHRRP